MNNNPCNKNFGSEFPMELAVIHCAIFEKCCDRLKINVL